MDGVRALARQRAASVVWRGRSVLATLEHERVARGVARRRLDEVVTESLTPHAVDGTQPVFVLSAGWRSGSTLLQRLVVSGGSTVVWGEPYPGHEPVAATARLVEMLASSSWRERSGGTEGIDADSWIANAYPTLDALGRATAAAVRALYVDPAHARADRWGIKEVRWGRTEIAVLRALFPDARFLLLVRDPGDAWASFRAHFPRAWFLRYPDVPVHGLWPFARHWRRLAEDFLAESEHDDVLLLRFEDLADSVAAIEAHIGSSVEAGVLDRRVRGSTTAATAPDRQRRRVRRLAGPVHGTLYG